MDRPSHVIEPVVGLSSPEMVRKRVLFPAPLAPMTVVIFDSCADIETPSSAITEPNEVVRFSIVNIKKLLTDRCRSG